MNNTEKRLRNKGWLSFREPNIHIDIISTKSITVRVTDASGRVDAEQTDITMMLIIQTLDTPKAQWGGFKTAGGWWYLEKNYDSRPLEAVYRDQMGSGAFL